jgi:hypothetical protein
MKQAEKLKGWLPVRDGEWPLVLATGTFASLANVIAWNTILDRIGNHSLLWIGACLLCAMVPQAA